jgi:hypothetical protein
MHPVERNINLKIIPSFATIDDVFSYVFPHIHNMFWLLQLAIIK